MLMGEFHHNIDEKNRLVIPSKFRSELGEQFIITRGLDKCLFIYSMNEWNKLVSKLNTLPFTQKNARNFTRFFLSGAINAEFDRSGRVCITSPLIEYADINKECVIIGASDRLEIWSKESWDKFLSDNEENFSDIAENLFTTGDYNAL
ncbi:MAG: division/cell wall cluster transcriptional repressor MraZ [Bacilli bacterium]|nr:division/cell wall cluster transcriptional repressor MraZ [Bacilli bacterium]